MARRIRPGAPKVKPDARPLRVRGVLEAAARGAMLRAASMAQGEGAEMSRIDKSKLPSRHATEGPERAPHRAFYYAMGLTDKEIHQPFVGVATTWNETAPCNITLRRQAQAVKRGVTFSGGTPREFTTITVTDGIAMGHQGMKASLVSREAIADTVELCIRGHAYDGLVRHRRLRQVPCRR